MKPEVDAEPLPWCQTGEALDLFGLSQQPWNAQAWVTRREKADKAASKSKAKTTFTKMDLTALIIAKRLFSVDTLLAYVQEHGSNIMQVYANKHQRRLS
eukprot:10541934-Karenia_brevis.AAC.1